jgi:hypothetical protein
VLPPILVLEEVAAPALGALENDLVAGHMLAISYPLSAIRHRHPQAIRSGLRIADNG